MGQIRLPTAINRKEKKKKRRGKRFTAVEQTRRPLII